MVKFTEKNSSETPKKRRLGRATAFEEQTPVPELRESPIVSHMKDTEEILEFIVSKLNEFEERNILLENEVKTLKSQPTVIDEAPKSFKRKIILNRDANGKIIGADVIDSEE